MHPAAEGLPARLVVNTATGAVALSCFQNSAARLSQSSNAAGFGSDSPVLSAVIRPP